MDIRKLQRAIVDGLEDVKAIDIVVFNTEHLSPLFERVIVASGASNRQTKALAASVRDAVKGQGLDVLRTEGEENGEWIIVDCGAAVAHIMQPAIRDYYRLEEIWGEKPVRMKLSGATGGLVKASEDMADDEPVPRKSPAKAKPTPRAPQPPRKAAPKTAASRKTASKTAPGRSTAATGSTTRRTPTQTVTVARSTPPAAKKPAVKKSTATRTSRPRVSPAGGGGSAATQAMAASWAAPKKATPKKTAPRAGAAGPRQGTGSPARKAVPRTARKAPARGGSSR
jgi:ribosome-associated protein